MFSYYSTTKRLEIERGDSGTLNFTFTQGSGRYDITGATVYFTVRSLGTLIDLTSTTDDTGASIAKSQSSHTDASNGETSISITKTDTTIAPGAYKYDVQIKTSGGDIFTIIKGDCIINSDVTRSS